MSDFKRIEQIYSDFADSLREDIPENSNPRINTVEMLSLSYCFEGLRQRTGLKTSYALGMLRSTCCAAAASRNLHGTQRYLLKTT